MATALPLEVPATTDGSALRTKILSISPSNISFILDGVSLAVANSLRRTMTADIPTLAIHAVEVNKNTSVLPDEMVAHRLGMIPLYSHDLDKQVPNFQRVSSALLSTPLTVVAEASETSGLYLHVVLRPVLRRTHPYEDLHPSWRDL